MTDYKTIEKQAFPSGESLLFWFVVALIVPAVLFGGGGSSNPHAEIIVQLAFVICVMFLALFVLVKRNQGVTFSRPASSYLAIGAAVLLLPSLHLIPLAPSVWSALPGRGVEVAALDLVGSSDRWMPMSVAPNRTLASLLAMVPPVVIMLAVAALGRVGRHRILLVLLCLGGLSVLLGLFQLVGGASSWAYPYGQTHMGYLVGFQASRNAQADILLIVLLATPALLGLPIGPMRSRMTVVAASASLAVAAILFTGSRAGILLALPVAVAIVLTLGIGQRSRWFAFAAATAVAVGAALLVWLQPSTSARMFDRFTKDSIGREALWSDTLYAITVYQPFGSGMGTFIPVFRTAESLDAVDPSLPVRAHNDLLEFYLEAGVIGLLWLIIIAAFLVLRIYRQRPVRTVSISRKPTISIDSILWLFGTGTLAIVALHSLVDYPLRSISIASLAAIAAGVLAPLPQRQLKRGSGAGADSG